MKIFIDSANIEAIRKWIDCGIADGVTTNPTVMCKDNVCDIEKVSKEIAKLIHPRPLSVEVTTNDVKEMLEQAMTFASWAANVTIKIPIINQYGVSCLEVIKRLSDKNIKVNATVLMSIGQLVLAAKAGASYVSIFAGRIGDEGGNAPYIIKQSKEWLDLWKFKSEIIIGSIRTVIDIQEAIVSGAHVVTIPPALLDKMCDHKYSRETVKQFMDDVNKTMGSK